MKKRIVAFLCLSVVVSLLVLGILFSHPFGVSDGPPSPDGTRVTVVTPSGDRDYAPPPSGNEIW